jgi:AraC-like DNA-binding protein
MPKVKGVNERLTLRQTLLPNVAIICAEASQLGALRMTVLELPLTLAGRASESSTIALDQGPAQPIPANVPFLATVRRRADIHFPAGSVMLVAAPDRTPGAGEAGPGGSALSTEPAPSVDLLITQAQVIVGRDLPPALARACEAGLLALLSVAREHESGGPPAGDHLFRDILADIAANCRQQDYGVAQVAQRYKLNVRTLQKMFQKQGTTLKEHITAARLKYAGAALLDPANAGKKVSDIAFEAGFNDIATFNRLFRRTFGRAPSAFRTEANQAAAGVARAEQADISRMG